MRKWYDLAISRQTEMARVITLENGKPLKESIGEIIYSTDYLELYSEEARRIHVSFLNLLNIQQRYLLIEIKMGLLTGRGSIKPNPIKVHASCERAHWSCWNADPGTKLGIF